MTSIVAGAPDAGGLLDRSRTVAGAGFNRWLVPPAALAIHLCIGMAYGLSVFWLPMSKLIAKPDAACAGQSYLSSLFATNCNWTIPQLLPIFTWGIVVLGVSAALFGGWLERAGPRKAGFIAALCWGGGFLFSGLGVEVHQLWMLWVGLGVVGGIGLGLGYISPVSTLVKWFPDRRGMATGMAIMGFGGGAMVGAPLANKLMAAYGVSSTLLSMGAIYLVAMMAGAFGYRVPPDGWRPQGWTPPAPKALVSAGEVSLSNALKTPQFWLIWGVLFLNVSAGIGVLGMAAPMLQEIFGGALVGKAGVGFAALDAADKAKTGAIAAGFLGLISLFNIAGRFFWASMSDRLGRKPTYFVFFALGIVLYALAPSFARMESRPLFVLAICLIISMYGGGFATVPAYLADMFGKQFVGAIHGRLLTAWALAGLVGPLIVGVIRQQLIGIGTPADHLYDRTFYVLAALLAVGFVCNALVRPVADRFKMSDAELAAAQGHATTGVARTDSYGIGLGAFDAKAAIAWALIAIPVLWGFMQALQAAANIFG